MLDQIMPPLLVVISAFLIPFIIIAIGSLIEEYVVNKTIKFKSYKNRFYDWFDRLVNYWE